MCLLSLQPILEPVVGVAKQCEIAEAEGSDESSQIHIACFDHSCSGKDADYCKAGKGDQDLVFERASQLLVRDGVKKADSVSFKLVSKFIMIAPLFVSVYYPVKRMFDFSLMLSLTWNRRDVQSEIVVNYSDFYKSELPASTTTALATMLRNSMSYTMSTGV